MDVRRVRRTERQGGIQVLERVGVGVDGDRVLRRRSMVLGGPDVVAGQLQVERDEARGVVLADDRVSDAPVQKPTTGRSHLFVRQITEL